MTKFDKKLKRANRARKRTAKSSKQSTRVVVAEDILAPNHVKKIPPSNKKTVPVDQDAALEPSGEMVNDPHLNDRTPQEFQQYMNRHENPAMLNEDISDFGENIDHISPELVAKLEVVKLFNAVAKAGRKAKFLLRVLRWILPSSERKQAMAPLADATEKAAYRQRKGVSNGLRAPTRLVCAALRHLMEKSQLFRGTRSGKKRVGDACASAFFVKKSNGKLRVIVDGRLANSFFDGKNAKFSLFTLETVKQVIDNLATTTDVKAQKWYALNLDLRHYFHQIPLPERYQNYLHIAMRDRNNKEGEYYAVPRAVPMGWTLAPIIAQCCTLGQLLGTKTEATKHPREADLPIHNEKGKRADDYLGMCSEYDIIPPWIPLNSGGGIFVLLDNVLIVTPRQETAEYWLKHIAETSTELHAIYKQEGEKEIVFGDELKQQMREHNLFVMENNNSKPFTFLGVDWYHSQHGVSVKDEETLPGREGKTTTFKTRRDVASIIGKLMWHRRVHRIRYHDNSKTSRAILSIYKKLTPQRQSEWNKPFEIDQAEVEGLVVGWEERRRKDSGRFCHARPMSGAFPDDSEIALVASDAAKKTRRAAYVTYSPSGQAKSFLELYPEKYQGDIAVAELYAIYMVVRDMAANNKLIVLATDSMVAKNWTEQGHGKNNYCLHLLAQIDQLLETSGCRLRNHPRQTCQSS